MTDSPLTAENGGILEEADVGPLALGEDPDDQKPVKKETVSKTPRQPSATSTESVSSRNDSQTTRGGILKLVISLMTVISQPRS